MLVDEHIKQHHHQYHQDGIIKVIGRPPKRFWWNASHTVRGKMLDTINSSIFCNTHLIALYKSLCKFTLPHRSKGNSINESTTIDMGETIHRKILDVIANGTSFATVRLPQLPRVSAYDEWFDDLCKGGCTTTLNIDSHNFTPPSTCHDDLFSLLFINTLQTSYLDYFDELNANIYLLKLIVNVLHRLQTDGTIVVLLPT